MAQVLAWFWPRPGQPKANEAPTDAPAVVFFAIPIGNPGFRDVDSALGGDSEKDAFIITPAFPTTVFRDNVIINGASQQLYTGDTNPLGPEIVLDGALTNHNALTLVSNNSIVHGLGIHSFGQAAVNIGGSENTVSDNYIGVDPTGTLDRGNGGEGVFIAGGSDIDPTTGNLITGNLISGNEAEGVVISGLSFDNVVSHNRIGADRTGTSAIGNAVGVRIELAQVNTVEDNLIAGNEIGIRLSQLASGNLIQHNEIGSSSGGPGNAADGVLIENSIGNAVWDNPIAGNGGNGVTVLDGTGNSLLRNSMYSNAGLGIDLAGDGVTPNDLGDGDTGPNDLQNYPELLFAQSAELTRVEGLINSTPNTRILLDFFANASLDESGFWEGQRWLQSKTITTDGDGYARFDYLLDGATAVGEWITTTATSYDTGSTSEFSGGVRAEEPTVLAVTNTNDAGPGSLRDAIGAANLMAGADAADIIFDIPETDRNFVDVDSQLPGGDADPDVFVISSLTELPALTRGNIVINGQSQQNATGDTNPFGPEIVLNRLLETSSLATLRLVFNFKGTRTTI